jgi:MoaA/NifB/PqqE/SkfB family radical SAM enzyme
VIEVTQACPLNCRGCYVPRDPKMMSLEDFNIVIGKTPPLEALNISGGEPLLNPHIEDMVKSAHAKGYQISLFTCGNIGIEKLDVLRHYLYLVRVTLKFPVPELDSYWRGKDDSHEKAVEFIKKARSLGIPVAVHYVVDTFNIGYVEDMKALISSLGAIPIALPFIDFTRGSLQNYVFEWDEWQKVAKDLESDGLEVEMMESTCAAGIKRFAINVEGNVRPCVYSDSSITLGNLIKEEWAPVHEKLKNWRKKLGVNRGRCPAYDDQRRWWARA